MSILKFKTAYAKSQEILVTNQIKKYPFKITDMILNHQVDGYDIELVNSKELESISTKDGRTYFDYEANCFVIMYNDKLPLPRKRFTLAHEFGHIVLRHITKEKGCILKNHYITETAADTFAGNLIAPPVIINELLDGDKFSIAKVSDYFNISVEATRTFRKNDYESWKMMERTDAENEIKNNLSDVFWAKKFRDFDLVNKAYSYINKERQQAFKLDVLIDSYFLQP